MEIRQRAGLFLIPFFLVFLPQIFFVWKIRLNFFAAVLTAGVCVMAVWLCVHKGRQLSYEGKSLDYWLEECRNRMTNLDQAGEASAGEAIRRIGPAALPALVELTRADYRGVRHGRTAGNCQWLSTIGFFAFGRAGSPAVPGLIALLDYSDPEVRKRVAINLEEIGSTADAAVPALLKHLYDSDPSVRLAATDAVECIEGRLELAIPALVKKLNGIPRDTNCFAATLEALLNFASYPEAQAAVPSLKRLLNDPDHAVRDAAAEILEEINSDAAKNGMK